MPKFIPGLKLNEMFYHFAQQHLLGVTQGALFSDGLGQLEPIRQKLACFPRDVWLYLLTGSIDQFSHSADLRDSPEFRRRRQTLYERAA